MFVGSAWCFTQSHSAMTGITQLEISGPTRLFVQLDSSWLGLEVGGALQLHYGRIESSGCGGRAGCGGSG